MAKIKVNLCSGDSNFFNKIIDSNSTIEVPTCYSVGEVLRVGPCILECVEIVEP